jgi:NodT family efflux transporter outer membrane factor (OMF) lipoprotein
MRLRYSAIILPALFTAGCLVGPSYRRPSVPVPMAFKELTEKQAAAGVAWKTAQPSDAARRGKWWEVFADPELNALEEEVTVSNQTIAVAEAQYRGARALVGSVRSSLFPAVGVGASVGRSSGVSTQSPGPGQAAPSVTAYEVPVEVSWQLDLFGRIRRGVQASVASAQASAADLEGVRLAMHAELALDYFLLHGLDAEIELLNKTAAGYRTTVELTGNRFKQGVVSGVDVAQAKTQLDATLAQATDLGISRAQLEHALAVLVGKPPAELSIPPATIRVAPPDIPIGLPSELLERRPDIAAAERQMAAANAQIGVAVAGYFPTLSLSGSAGYRGSKLAGLFSLPNRLWSLGASLFETLFDGGQRRAVKRQAVAAYDANVAGYRQTVLTAFEQVEDNLAALRILAEEAQYQADAVAEAELALKLANNRYMNGVTSYLEVVTAQSTALTNERLAVELLTRQMTASVSLIEAVGGGWRASDLANLEPVPAGSPSSTKKQTPTSMTAEPRTPR